MIEEKVVEKTGEIVLGAAINKLNAYKNKKEWSKLFIDAGEIFLKQVEGGENIVEDMSALLSKENMKELAKKTDEGSRYLLKDALHREMRSLMLRYEIAAQEAELYISHFMTVIMHELEKEAPTVYQKAYLGEWREQEEKQLAEIKKSINCEKFKVEKLKCILWINKKLNWQSKQQILVLICLFLRLMMKFLKKLLKNVLVMNAFTFQVNVKKRQFIVY